MRRFIKPDAVLLWQQVQSRPRRLQSGPPGARGWSTPCRRSRSRSNCRRWKLHRLLRCSLRRCAIASRRSRLADWARCWSSWCSPRLLPGALRCLLRQIGVALCWRLDLTVQHRAIVLAGAAPHRHAQLKELLTAALVHLKALAGLHELIELPHQLRGKLHAAIENRGLGILRSLRSPQTNTSTFHGQM